MDVQAWPLREPLPDDRRLVRPIVVEHEMHVQVGWDLRLDRIEKLAKLHGPMPSVKIG